MSTTNTSDLVQRLADESNIRDLVARFANACSPPDMAAFAKLWVPDSDTESESARAVWTLSEPFAMSETGVSSIVAMMGRLLEQWDFFVQLVHSGVIEIDETHGATSTRATGRWILREVAKGASNSEAYYNNFAVYEDQYVKVDGKWYFTRRDYKYMFLDSGPFGGDACPPIKGWYGGR
ncbi:hypothetical protein PV08_01573 [Exophiala spinifera]|uniref:SnoaL-like domain-containing protein n=1 Tax=Exophiala spinifera TaxID=91928 RepID=A0A0D2CBW9_9EURO|nr:uncharacterized protein PV08_01573 [Exophiala spinifera]KIW20994.1 hypothetical protein PV08_01573 [Exophiala spinifera]